MLVKEITYTDFNGVVRTETFRFNLMQSEIAEMEMSTAGGLQQMINKIVEAQDNAKIIAVFKDLVLKAYGEKSDDGKRFIKSPEMALAFSQTEAYSILFMELATDPDKASEFINGIVPQTDKSASNNAIEAKNAAIVEMKSNN